MTQQITLRVNGTAYELEVDPQQTLLEVLRRELNLFGAREACGIGICGTCTVLADGKPISACLKLAVTCTDVELTTVEGLGDNGELSEVQQAFVDHNAFQCSYCTPGFILASTALLAEQADPSREQIRHYLAGNLCRCGSYVNILEAVEDAAQRKK